MPRVKLGATDAARLRAQLLSGPRAGEVDAVVDRLLAVQAQDARGARLAVRSRSIGTRAADVDGALNDRSMVIAWLNRGTLHLVAADDYWWLHPLTTPLRNQLVRGPMRGREHAFVAAPDWLGEPPQPLARSDALARLARRYLAGHGPADARDLARWAGLPLVDAPRRSAASRPS